MRVFILVSFFQWIICSESEYRLFDDAGRSDRPTPKRSANVA